MHDIKIRQAKPSDGDGINAISEEVFKQKEGHLSLPNVDCYVAVDKDERVIGYALAYPLSGGRYILESIAVIEAYRNTPEIKRDVAKRLFFQIAQKEACKRESMEWESSDMGVRFYASIEKDAQHKNWEIFRSPSGLEFKMHFKPSHQIAGDCQINPAPNTPT